MKSSGPRSFRSDLDNKLSVRWLAAKIILALLVPFALDGTSLAPLVHLVVSDTHFRL